MTPWWNRHRRHEAVCRRCHRMAILHDGVCHECRTRLAEETGSGEEWRERSASREHLPPEPSTEPPHDRPWVHRSGG